MSSMADSKKQLLLGAALGAGSALGLLWLRNKLHTTGEGSQAASKEEERVPVTVVTAPHSVADVDDEADPSLRAVAAVDVVETDDVKIREFFGGASTGTGRVSIAHVVVKRSWNEEWQRPEFDEWTVVLKGVVRIERACGSSLNVRGGEAVLLPKGELVRWVFPDPTNPPEYVAICAPAFSPDNCGRGEQPRTVAEGLPAYEAEPLLFHAAPKKEWESALKNGQPYFPATYQQDGFVHATARAELLMPVLNHFYRSHPEEFVCLKMERSKLATLGVRAVFEFPAPVGNTATSFSGGSELFPHIYSGISEEMVSAVGAIKRSTDGEFLEAEM